MFTIEDLRKGNCIVINDGTLDQIKKVLKHTFPNVKFESDGHQFGFSDEDLLEIEGFTMYSVYGGDCQPVKMLKPSVSQSVIDFYNQII